MNRIVVLMTTSPGSQLALDEGIKLATATRGVIELVRIGGLRRSSAQLARAESWLAARAADIPKPMRGGVEVLVGPPGAALRSVAEAHAATTVIVGASTYGALLRIGVDEAFVESVGPRLLIVRPNAEPVLHPHTTKREHDRHPLLEAMTLTGAATGAVVGAIAGPPGALVGAALGSAVGLLAGSALEQDEDETGARDQELDEEIGVTRGSVGLDGLVLPSGPLVAVEDASAAASPGGAP